MTEPTADLLQTAISHHRRGELKRAEAIYKRLLSANPNQPDALHLWGVLAHQTGRVLDALDAMQRAEMTHSQNPVFHFNFARALADHGDINQAVNRYHKAISLKPDFAEAYQNLASLLLDQQLPNEALAVCRTALSHGITNADIMLHYGQALERTGATDEAIAVYNQLLTQEAPPVKAFLQLAELYHTQGEKQRAIETLSRAHRLLPNSVAIRNNLARLLQDAGRLDEAIIHYRHALKIAPDCFEILINLATAYKERGDINDAIRLYERALEYRPNGVEAWHNLGVLYQDEGLLSAAEACFDTALRYDPQHAAVRSQRALVWLQQGRFEQGWPEYDWRLAMIGKQLSLLNGIPLWQGEPLTGKTLFVAGEQGIGDQILFATCLNSWDTAPACLILLCAPRLAPLIARAFPEENVIVLPDNTHGRQRVLEMAERIDVQIALASLPRYCRTDFASFTHSRRLPLQAAPDRVQQWRVQLQKSGRQAQRSVGISWRGGARTKDRLRRSAPLEQWALLLNAPGSQNIQWVCLQYDDCDDDLEELQRRTDVSIHRFPSIAPLADLEEFSALVAALDLVISVDNTTVHLAGGLGTLTWAMLPEPATWYWFQERQDCPWYADVKLFRQSRPGDWPGVFSRVAQSLTSWLTHPENACSTA